MEQRELLKLLDSVAAGDVAPAQAAESLRVQPFSDLGFAKVDHHRGIRQGVSEIIYGAGKSADQIAGIVANMIDAGQERILITRIAPDRARAVEELLMQGLAYAGIDCQADAESDDAQWPAQQGGFAPGAADDEPIPELPLFTYYDLPRLATIGDAPEPDGAGTIVVACGGTSDIYAAEEAALTAEMLGNRVERLYDVGVAGLHRLLAHADVLSHASVVVAVAGMEGALPSVVGGLVSCPVVAVPTSVGYGASFNGATALLAMLNSCASGVSVVNIDNGFGAGYQASLINHVRPAG